MHPTSHRRRAAAFSLVELLAVLVVISLLTALGMSAWGRFQQSSREAAGLNNLRQIIVAARLYMQDNENRLPPARRSSQMHFYTELNPYLNTAAASATTSEKIHPVFRDPAAAQPGGVNHYTMNANIGHYYAQVTGGGLPPTPLVFERPSEVAVFFDGAQVHAGNAELFGWAVDGGNLNGLSMANAASWFGQSYPSQPVAKGPNQDAPNTMGNIRWRNRNGNAAKFAFLDGRVELLRPEETPRKFFLLP